MVISHHPLVFKGLKRFTGSSYVDRTLIKAIKNDVAIYAIHTNLDNVADGVNKALAEKIGLQNKIVFKKLFAQFQPDYNILFYHHLYNIFYYL